MVDATITGERVDVVQTTRSGPGFGTWSGVSWSAIIAGAFTAIAVTIIIVALGSGIGMALTSPYATSPSATTLTIIGAVWLVFSQAVGFATGGYVAGRLRRNPADIHTNEIRFRDGANGLVVWAIGVVVSSLILASAVAKVGATATEAAGMSEAGVSGSQLQPIDYFTDKILRTTPPAANGAAAGAANATETPASQSKANDAEMRSEVKRVLIATTSGTDTSADDRTYLAQIISARTGISANDAQQKVDGIVNQARASLTKAADTARKAAAFLSFWTFMSLLFGAACATLGGVIGGDLRDAYAIQRASPTAPK